MNKQRIAILMHRCDEHAADQYFISALADHWSEDGHQVILLFGTERFVPADLLIVHVDLSVVPDSYLAFAERYPIAINGDVRDIRKSTFSPGLLQPNDNWEGPVIVKSDRNFAGSPEQKRGGLIEQIRQKSISAVNRLGLDWFRPLSPLDYRIYEHLQEVPRLHFYQPDLIVQRFMPEVEDGLYCMRVMLFLGDRFRCIRLKADHPIVNGSTTIDWEDDIEPHPEIVRLRDQLQFDFGKFDYVVTDGQAILLDTNKTVGYPHQLADSADKKARLRYYSSGLYSFLKG